MDVCIMIDILYSYIYCIYVFMLVALLFFMPATAQINAILWKKTTEVIVLHVTLKQATVAPIGKPRERMGSR